MSVTDSENEAIQRAVFERVEEERERWGPKTDPHREPGSEAQALTSKEILEELDRNEDGDASLFIDLHRDRFCFDHSAGRWYEWAGHYWKEDFLNEALAGIEKVIGVYAEEAKRQAWNRVKCEKAGQKDGAERHAKLELELLKRIRGLQSKGRKEDILFLSRTGAASLGITGNEWDKNSMILGCPNCVIDLCTGKDRPGRPGDFIKTITAVEWRGLDEGAPIWERALFEIFDGDTELISYLQRLLGYSITGKANYHVYPIFYGPEGRNGKGTILESLKFTLGKMAHKAKSETLLDSKYGLSRGAADADTLSFRGKRIIWASETDQGRRLRTSRIKELCGGNTLNARAPYGRDIVEFQPTHLLILLTNNKP